MKKTSDKTGLPPGTPVFVGEQKTEKVKITVINYDQDHFAMREVTSVDDCFSATMGSAVTWINVDGLHDTASIERLGRHYGLHPLIVEDILNTHQRLKIDVFDTYLLIVLKMYMVPQTDGPITSEQVSLIVGENVVLTFQEQEGDLFTLIRNRLQHDKGRIRKAGADYLAYALIDAVVDGYFELLDYLGEQIELIEEELMPEPKPDVLPSIHRLKRELILFRKSVWPLRTMIGDLERQDSSLIKASTAIYLRDLYDHTIQVVDTIEAYREMTSGLLDVYLSSLSNKMNEIMKFLTIIGTIFIPLTFLAGIYGMNFECMPELHWRWGYVGVLVLMVAIGITLLAYFKKKRWL